MVLSVFMKVDFNNFPSSFLKADRNEERKKRSLTMGGLESRDSILLIACPLAVFCVRVEWPLVHFTVNVDGSSWTSYVFYLVDVLFAIPRFFARDSLILVLYSSQLLHLHFLVLKSFGYSPRVFLLPVGVGVGIEARFATRFFATCMFFTNLSLCEACSKMSD